MQDKIEFVQTGRVNRAGVDFEMFSRPDGANSACDIYPQLKLRAIFGCPCGMRTARQKNGSRKRSENKSRKPQEF